ncbi:MAG TPA: lipid IV(A) 3-deoxy-D-manno-octulosonic acid transferase [Burkholderiales bacterium]
MARLLYTLLLWLILPFIFLRLAWRAQRQPEYLRDVGERFGSYAARASTRPVLWLHAVSVGETRAAQPLVRELSMQYPGHDLVLTCMTPTGRAAAHDIYAGEARITIAYLPYDYPYAVRRFLRHFRPVLGLIMETEIWPNLVAGCNQAGVPLALVNARLSARSAAGYARIAALARPAFAGLTRVTAQSEEDRARLVASGARAVEVTGNLKFDVAAPPQLVERGQAWRAARGGRAMLLAASTREGEEVLLLDALAPLLRQGVLLAIVPRHPQRFDEVARLIEARGHVLGRRSHGETVAADVQVWLGDSMGEMPAYYAAADCAYVGGSLLPFGGQNLIEACALGCPVLIGPHTYNFAQAAELAVVAGAARRVADAAQLAAEAARLLEDAPARGRMADAGIAFAQAHRGATQRTLQMIAGLLPAPT